MRVSRGCNSQHIILEKDLSSIHLFTCEEVRNRLVPIGACTVEGLHHGNFTIDTILLEMRHIEASNCLRGVTKSNLRKVHF